MKDALDPSEVLSAQFLDPDADGALVRVVRLLVCRGASSSADIAVTTGLSRASVSTALAELREKGVVIETATDSEPKKGRGRGRPQMLQSVTPGVGLAAGVLFGLRELRVMLSDAAHETIEEISIPMPIDYRPEQATEVLHDELSRLVRKQDTNLERLLGLGLAIAAPVSPEGKIERGSIVPEWDGIDLAATFGDAFPCPVHADNESNCAARAKMLWGAARGLTDFVYVIFDFGIGGAIVSAGRVLRGADGFAAEFGHMPVEHPGRLCRCGKRGCLETLATIDVVLDELSRLKGAPVTLDALQELIAQNDETALRVVEEAARSSGRALATIASVLSPGHFVVDGILTRLGAPFLDPLRKACAEDVRGHMPEIVDAASDDDDTVRGAVSLVLCRKGLLAKNAV